MDQETYSKEGHTNLVLIEKADNFTDWMYSEIKPFLKGTILEIGSGIGTYSDRVIRDFAESKVIVSDIDESYVKMLNERYKSCKKVLSVKLDITNAADLEKVGVEKLDTIFALNVLEHIERDMDALNNLHNSLNEGGRLILLVPAHKFLFNCIDEGVGHYRRYTREELLQKANAANFKVMKMFYFNFFSIFGWYLNGNILKKKVINEGAMGLFNSAVPIIKIFERYLLMKKMGVSIIAVLEKENHK